MNRITARDIQIFVAGAFAYFGFRALIGLPHDFVFSFNFVTIFAAITTGLAFPIGISILLGRRRAVLLAQVFLWFVIASCFISVPIYCHAVPTHAAQMIWYTIPDLVDSVLLLILIFWSRSLRFKDKSSAQISN